MTEVNVVELTSANSLLPNMTISIEDDDDDENVVDVSYEEENCEANNKSEDSQLQVQFKVEFPQNHHLYENKKYKELHELGLTVEEAKEKRDNRAKRFDIPVDDNEEMQVDVVDDGLDEKASQLVEEITNHNTALGDDEDVDYIRVDALYINGVDMMSTDDIFKLFDKYLPRHIEWIDDSSCNVLWEENTRVAQVLLQVTNVNDEQETTVSCPNKQQNPPDNDTNKKEVRREEDLDNLDLMDTSDALQDDAPPAPEENKEKVEVAEEALITKRQFNSLRQSKDNFTFKDKKFMLRFACKGDRKLTGASRKSKYYRRHGNPHYGGMTGVISSSYRRRFQMKRAHTELKEMNVETSSVRQEKRRRRHGAMKYEREKTLDELEDEDLLNTSAKDLEGAIYIGKEEGEIEESADESNEDEDDSTSPSPPAYTMTMRADREELSARKRVGSASVTTSSSGVRSRLGAASVTTSSSGVRSRLGAASVTTSSSGVKSRLGRKTATARAPSSDEDEDDAPAPAVTDLREWLRNKRKA